MRESDARKITSGRQPLTEGYQPVIQTRGYQPLKGKTFDGFQPTPKDLAQTVTRPLPLGGSSVIPAGASYSDDLKPTPPAVSKK
jgi:hypothetical protein